MLQYVGLNYECGGVFHTFRVSVYPYKVYYAVKTSYGLSCRKIRISDDKKLSSRQIFHFLGLGALLAVKTLHGRLTRALFR